MSKPKILVVGSFMMDQIALTPRAPIGGETVIGTKFKTAPGGKGANQAVQCAKLGADVTMIGQVGGDDIGKFVRKNAASFGVDVSHVLMDENESTGVAMITVETAGGSAQNRIIVCPGANFTLKTGDIEWLKNEIGQYDLVMMQLELPMEIVEAVSKWAFDAGTSVMLNPAPAAPLSDELLSHVTYLSPNEHEAAQQTGHIIRIENGVSEEDVDIVSRYYLKRGVKNLIITLGENGSVMVDRNGVERVQCVKMPDVTDTTAAGDSFVAAFCSGISAGLARGEALKFASYTSAITVTRLGAMPSLPTRAEVCALLRERGEMSLANLVEEAFAS